jgi:hypothetical protein
MTKFRCIKVISVIREGAKRISKRYDLLEDDECVGSTYDVDEARAWTETGSHETTEGLHR